MKDLIVNTFLVFGLLAGSAFGQDGQWHHHNGRWHNHRHTRYHYHNNVGYQPVVRWYPSGTYLNAGPVFASPNRRFVRFGINAGFSQYQGFHTFNYHTGQTRWYPK